MTDGDRIAFVTDIHGNLPALEAVVADLRRRDATHVVNLGDSLSGPLLPQETARYLMASGWFHLAGNHERQILSDGPDGHGASDTYARSTLSVVERAWIASLAATGRYDEHVVLCHGTPRRDDEHLLETFGPASHRSATLAEVDERLGAVDAEVVVCGHSHVPRVVRTATGRVVVNPGSVGLQAYADDEPFRYTVEMRSPDARYAIVERVDGHWVTTLIAVPYEHEPMARLAEARQRPEWAAALRTGELPR